MKQYFKFKLQPNAGYTLHNINIGDVVSFEDSEEKFVVTNILGSPFPQEATVFTYDTKDNFFKKINENYDKESS